MKFLDLIKLSTRMFKARTSRTILTILGMGVGVGAILFLVSLGYGLQKTLLEKITTSDSLLTLDVTESGSGENVMGNSAVSDFEKIEGVVEISPKFNVNVRGKIDDLTSDLFISDIKPSFLRLGGVKIKNGETLNDNIPYGAVMTTSAVKAFNMSEEEILNKDIDFVIPASAIAPGKSKPTTTKYRIIGIVEEDSNVVYVNSLTLDFLKIDKFDQIKVKCASNNIMGSVREKIVELGYMVSSLSDAVDQANKVFRIIQIVLGCFGVIALIVSAIGMFNTMTIALLERTVEIGIMKSIGASDLSISAMFITEATVMGFLGGIGGVLMGFLGGQIFNMLINFVATHLGGESLKLFYSPSWFLFMIIGFGTIVGSMTGVIPARRASNIDPLDALRNK